MKLTIIACLLMAVCVPFSERLAVSASSPAYTHCLYMAGHAGWLHYLVNAWSLLVLHNLFRWYRILAAYIFSVILSYFPMTDKPMLGASVIVCFFIGLVIVHLWRRQRLSAVLTMALLALTCVLPGFAGPVHVAAFAIGSVFFQCEVAARKFMNLIEP